MNLFYLFLGQFILQLTVAGRDSWGSVFNRNEVCPYIGCEPMLDLLSLRSKNNDVITISFIDFMI